MPSFSRKLCLALLPWDLAFAFLVPAHRIKYLRCTSSPRLLAPRTATPPRRSINSLVTTPGQPDREMEPSCTSAAFIRCRGYLTITRDRLFSHWNLYHLLPLERAITSDISLGPVARYEDASSDATAHRNCSKGLDPVKWLSSDIVEVTLSCRCC